MTAPVTRPQSDEALGNRRRMPLRSALGDLPRRQGVPPRTNLPVRGWVLVLAADVLGLLLPVLSAAVPRSTMLLLAVTTVLAYQSARLYRPRLSLSVLSDLPLLARRFALAALFVFAVCQSWTSEMHAAAFAVEAACMFLSAVLCRALAYLCVRSARTSRRVEYRTLVLGGGHVGQHLADVLTRDASFGLSVVGIVDESPVSTKGNGSPRRLPLAHVPQVLQRREVDVLLVAFGSHSELDVVDVLLAGQRSRTEVLIVPRLFEAHSLDGHHDHIDGIPILRLRRPRHASFSRHLKRALDLLVSLAALVVLAPLMVVIALAVRYEGGPGVLFRQVRVGRDGVEFELLKFRSLRPLGDESATRWSVATDDRIGRVGRFLRRTSLDELPQLLNVVRGDMSIVGPRPERPHFVTRFGSEIPRYRHRHRVPCGLTGLAQVNGLRGDTSIVDRARFDNYYIEHWSLYLDLKIMLLTFREVLLATGR